MSGVVASAKNERSVVAGPLTPKEDDGGYAAVDALIALLILSMTLTLAINAGLTANRIATTADEASRANRLMGFLAESPASDTGSSHGGSGGFDWTVTDAAASEGPGVGKMQVCVRRVDVVSHLSRRRYELETARICEVRGEA